MTRLLVFLIVLAISPVTLANDSQKKFRKTQEVNFDGTDIDGVVRSPDGAYLLQKRGVKFTPLYKVDAQMEQGILDSINYLK
jgi:hypothetical protein